MMCYADKTFCTYNIICKNSNTCNRILTEEIKQSAKKANLLISVFADFPECYTPWFIK